MEKIKISFSREVAETLGLESAVILELFNQNLLDNSSYDDLVLSSSLTGFATKSFMMNDRWTVSPMLAVSNPFVTVSLDTYDTNWNTDVMVIAGLNNTYNLTQRFGLNIGVTAIEATIKGFPTLVNFMIGGRFSF